MTPTVRTERHGGIAVVEIDHPPHNALGQPVRAALAAALRAALDDAEVKGVVLAGTGRGFIAGAEMAEIAAPEAEPTLAVLCALLDAAGKPVVAALHGAALGEGLDLALACHARVMAPDASVGLPEARIGMLSGALPRLLRLAGAMAALDIATSGRQVAADEAMKLGLADEVATDWRQQAVARAEALAAAGHWPVTSARDVPAVDRATFDTAARAVAKRARGAVAPAAA
ncbi:MAG: enoyl-CoA hydratase/isomerase family protein, partial [Alphaproteobacteria bacterium]|nr:enoyl-CoA hydratase/isomerase family protein [Alphaproteobacteria bacterium]